MAQIGITKATTLVGTVLCAGAPLPLDAELVIPVYNEEAELASSVLLAIDAMTEGFALRPELSWRIVIVDNASTDSTWRLACKLARRFPQQVRALCLPSKGRGRALKAAWSTSAARVMGYMDVDLSTDISLIPELLDPILEGAADLCFGSRLLPESSVERCTKREVISRCYNAMLRSYLHVGFRDAQCGFKAISAEAAQMLLPAVEDDEWFFDTELLVRAEALGIAMREIPVRWREDPGTTVDILDTAFKDVTGMRRLKRQLRSGDGAGGDGMPLARRAVRA